MPRIVTPLRLAIVASGRTQREVAETAHLGESRLSLIVNGHWNPDEATRQAIADALHRSVDELWPADEARAA